MLKLCYNFISKKGVNLMKPTEKYKQIILNSIKYGADADGKFDETKLSHLVYLIDFTWYYENLVSMSGVEYRKLPHSSVADVYFCALNELEASGTIIREPKGNAVLFSLIETEAPDSRLTEDELILIDKIGKAWSGKSTEDIANFTHEQLPWQICRDNEIIPYGLITQEAPERVHVTK